MGGFGASKTSSALGIYVEAQENEVELPDGNEQVGAAPSGVVAKAIVAGCAAPLASACCESETSYELPLGCPVLEPMAPP